MSIHYTKEKFLEAACFISYWPEKPDYSKPMAEWPEAADFVLELQRKNFDAHQIKRILEVLENSSYFNFNGWSE